MIYPHWSKPRPKRTVATHGEYNNAATWRYILTSVRMLLYSLVEATLARLCELAEKSLAIGPRPMFRLLSPPDGITARIYSYLGVY